LLTMRNHCKSQADTQTITSHRSYLEWSHVYMTVKAIYTVYKTAEQLVTVRRKMNREKKQSFESLPDNSKCLS